MTTDETRAVSERRELAMQAFNSAWDLIEKTDRTPDEDREMLVRAAASHYLWQGVGGDEQMMIANWQVAHVLSWLGIGPLALTFAQASLAIAEGNGWTDWRRASAYEGVARAYAVLGDAAERDRYADLCRSVLDTLDDPAIIAGQLATVPGL